jgi:hypothetical protein
MPDLEGTRSIEIAAPVERCFAIAADLGSWHFQDLGDAVTLATYTLEIGVGRRLAVLVRTVRGPVRNRIEALLADRPVQGLKARAEQSSCG